MGIDFLIKRNRSIYWQQIRADPCHRYGCPEYLLRTSPVARPALTTLINLLLRKKYKNQKNQRIRVTARPATELSPTHDFGLPDSSSKNIQKQKKIFFFLTPKKKKKKKKKS